MKIIEELTEKLTYLSGVGNKTAGRYSYDILDMKKEKREELITAIKNLEKIKICQICNGYSLGDICEICQEKHRDPEKLVVVAHAKDIDKIEKILSNKYYYYVLQGIIDPLNGISIEDLQIQKLFEKINNQQIKELILVLPTNNEGELTAAYIKKKLANQEIKVTKLAQGVPIGGELEYLDELTLLKSIEQRQEY